MKNILVFGAGKSATVLIEYLLLHAAKEEWFVYVADANISLAEEKINQSSYGKALSFDILKDEKTRQRYIAIADIVISLLPPTLHYIVAKDCVNFSRNLLTASYVDEKMLELKNEIEDKNLFFLCEMGLDPGIDHMSAMEMIHDIHRQGGEIISFQSHCGGLLSPKSDDNPWHYKISWSPGNIVRAGKSGARYRESGEDISVSYQDVFTTNRFIDIPEFGVLSYYPNRDSLHYIESYGLDNISTFIRTTLRHPDFIYGWKNIIDLKLTDETPQYNTQGKTLADLFKEHMNKNGFGDWLSQKMEEQLSTTKDMLQRLMDLMSFEDKAQEQGEELPSSFLTADEKGNITEIELDEVKDKAAGFIAHSMHEANLTLKQLFYLGLDDTETKMPAGIISPADLLQFALEKKLALQPGDKDMIVMMHEIKYEVNGETKEIKSSLLVKGDDSIHTAMAKTVGLPLGIAAKLILQEKIKLSGLYIPTHKEIYEPVLQELKDYGIAFKNIGIKSI